MAAAAACLAVYDEVDVIGHMEELGHRLLKGMQALADEAELKVIFGGHQQMGGYLFLYEDPSLNYDLATLFLQEMAERGVLIGAAIAYPLGAGLGVSWVGERGFLDGGEADRRRGPRVEPRRRRLPLLRQFAPQRAQRLEEPPVHARPVVLGVPSLR